MNKLEQCLRDYLAKESPGLTLDRVETVSLREKLELHRVVVTVELSTRWSVPVTYTEGDLKNAEALGFARAVGLLRQTGRTSLADELERAWIATKG